MSIQEYNETYAVIHLLAHLINLDFNNAKFLVKRFDVKGDLTRYLFFRRI